MDRKGELVMVDGEDLLGLEVKNNFFEIFRRSVDIAPIGIVLTVFQESKVNRAKPLVYLSKTLVIAAVSSDIDLASAGFDQERSPECLIPLA